MLVIHNNELAVPRPPPMPYVSPDHGAEDEGFDSDEAGGSPIQTTTAAHYKFECRIAS